MTYLDKNQAANQPNPIHLSKLNSQSSIKLEELITFLINNLKPTVLSELQEKIIRGSWQQKTYSQIADITHNDPAYLKGIGSNLWQMLSEILSEEVTKRNLRLVGKRNYQKFQKFNRDFQEAEINTPKVTNVAINATAFCNKTVTSKYHYWDEVLDVSFFRGRAKELATLEKWITQDKCRLVALIGMGGMGKTALATKLAQQVESQFELVIWKSLRNQPEFKPLIEEINNLICDRQDYYFSDNIDGQINNLITCLRQKRCLLIFDGVDNILAAGEQRGKYSTKFSAYGQLLRRIQDEKHQSCALITSREKPTGIDLREKNNAKANYLVRSHQLQGLKDQEIQDILTSKNLLNSNFNSKQLVKNGGGNPLILQMIMGTIENLFQNNVQSFLDYDLVLYGDVWQLIDQQWQRLSSTEKQVMSYLTLKKEQVNLQQLVNGLKSQVTFTEIVTTLESLQGRAMIKVYQHHFVQQPIIRSYLKQKIFNTNSH